MSRYSVLHAAVVVAVLAGCSNRTPTVNPFRANVGETLTVALGPALVPQAIRALQGSTTLDDAKVELQIQPAYPARRTSALETSVYTDALDDAGAKAQAIAAHSRRPSP